MFLSFDIGGINTKYSLIKEYGEIVENGSFLTKDKETTLPDRLFIFCIPQNAASHLLTPSQGQVGNRNRRFCLPLRNEGLTSTRQYRNPV